MDLPSYHRDLNTLRHRVILYLAHLSSLLIIIQQPFLPQPFPDDPTSLPFGFPHSDFVHTRRIDWYEDAVRHVYDVNLTHVVWDRERQRWSQPEWIMSARPYDTYEGRQLIGFVAVDPRIYYDPHPVIEVTGSLIVDVMVISVQMSCAMHVCSRVQRSGDQVLEIAEIKNRNGHFVKELSRRVIPERTCIVCRVLLPPAGPNICAQHRLSH